MKDYFTLITVFVSGIFGLIVAVASNYLATRRETTSHSRDQQRQKREKVKALYTDFIASLEKCIRHTESTDDYDAVREELPKLNARLRLSARDEIVHQGETVGDLIYAWSSEYRQGMPKRVGDSGMAIVSSHDSKHTERAKEIFPKLHDEINKLIELMKSHLQTMDKQT